MLCDILPLCYPSHSLDLKVLFTISTLELVATWLLWGLCVGFWDFVLFFFFGWWVNIFWKSNLMLYDSCEGFFWLIEHLFDIPEKVFLICCFEVK